MKKLSPLKLATCLAAISAFALMGSANAQVLNENAVVNVQMGYDGVNNGAGTGTSVAGDSYTAVAANTTPMAYNGSTWNIEAASPYDGTNTAASQTSQSNLLYSTGGMSGINYSISANLTTHQQVVFNPNMPLLSNILANYPNGAPGTLALTGLNNALTYDITIESYSGSFFAGSYTLGASTQSITPNGGAGAADVTSWVNGMDYVEFDNIAPTSGTITITEADGASFAGISGFQVGANEAPAEVPEPTSVALIGVGALALLIGRRRMTGFQL